ncbi:MAG TPA: DUF3108 domain-containing protein [Gemmatimonadaceae bacterium]|nr:DUF3108 domain-containing protein [Gemmatimonadaceae bacterium]
MSALHRLIRVLQFGVAVTSAASVVAGAQVITQQASIQQVAAPQVAARAVPFVVGEELTYHATLAHLPAGTARMRVAGIDTIRGREAYHIVFTMDGGVPGFRVHDRHESWLDTRTLSSLRYKQQISDGGYHRSTVYEIFPERSMYQRGDDSLVASVGEPLDEGSFIYFVRAAGVEVGETRRLERYFKPEGNPVVLTGVVRDTIRVGAGTFATIRIHPTIHTKGLFAEDGDAQVWFTDDERRYPVQVKARFSKFTLALTLESISFGPAPVPPGAHQAAVR